MTFVTRNPNRPTITPERRELYARVADVSRGGRSLYDQAEALGLSHGQLKHLRHKAYVYGFEITPVDARFCRGPRYDTAESDAKAAAAAARCPRCGLCLPCNGCLASNAAEHAERHMYRESL
jgi:hypothetical protein